MMIRGGVSSFSCTPYNLEQLDSLCAEEDQGWDAALGTKAVVCRAGGKQMDGGAYGGKEDGKN